MMCVQCHCLEGNGISGYEDPDPEALDAMLSVTKVPGYDPSCDYTNVFALETSQASDVVNVNEVKFVSQYLYGIVLDPTPNTSVHTAHVTLVVEPLDPGPPSNSVLRWFMGHSGFSIHYGVNQPTLLPADIDTLVKAAKRRKIKRYGKLIDLLSILHEVKPKRDGDSTQRDARPLEKTTTGLRPKDTTIVYCLL